METVLVKETVEKFGDTGPNPSIAALLRPSSISRHLDNINRDNIRELSKCFQEMGLKVNGT